MSARLAGGPTERQAEALTLLREGKTVAEVARVFGISDRNAHALIKRGKRREEQEAEQPEGVRAAIAAAGAQGFATGGWIKTKGEDGTRVSVQFRLPQEEDDPEAWLSTLRDGLMDVRAEARVVEPAGPGSLHVVFPVADLHIGMLADPEETGTAWDTKIALAKFSDAFQRLVAVSPPAETAVLAQLGDLTHVDDQRNVTPGHGHQLDADTRFFLILRRAVAAMKLAIETLRAKYPRVVYRGTRGNHDVHSHYAVTLALAEYYRDCPDVEIVEAASEFYIHEHGRNMIVLHHGDRAKPERLVHFAAATWPEVWGRTRHRFAFSGHVHHETKREIGGMTCESFGTIIPRDAYAAANAYVARRSLVSITLDATEGEIARARVGVN